MRPFTVVVSVCDSDRDQAVRLFEWIGDMEDRRVQEQSLRTINKRSLLEDDYQLLILDTGSYGSVGMLQVEAKRAFSKRSFCGELPVAPWPQGPNSSFLMACKLAQTPFLWLEPDCVPMRDTWLDEICDEYYAQGKPFMGTIVRTEEQQMLENKALPMRHMTGCGVYPAYAREFYHAPMGDQPWDLFAAAQILPFVHDTQKIWHRYGEPGLPPTFVDRTSSDSPRNALAIDSIPKKACLAHRVKDGTLIELLRKGLT